jgi:hypothetical protein
MCIGGGSKSYTSQVAPVTLPSYPTMTAPTVLQATPASARPNDQTTYKKKGKRALMIPQSSGVNVPGT